MFLQLVFCAVIGVYGVKGQFFDKCSKEILTEIKTCISNSADFSSMSSEAVMSFFTNPTAAVCSNKTELISLTKCVYDALIRCFDDSFKTLFPTNEMNEKTLNYLCTRINSYNGTCVLSSIVKIAPCILEGLDLSSNPTYDEMKAYFCGSQKNGKKCIEHSKDFNKCPETKKTFLELNKLQNPEACGGEAGFERGVFGSAPPSESTTTTIDQPESTTTTIDQSESTTTTIDQSESTTTTIDQSENTAPSLYQSVVLLTTITLMEFIF